MTMNFYDGFDWVGDSLPGRTALRDIQSRGWRAFGGAVIDVDEPTVLWEQGSRTPLGKSLHITGGTDAYIEHATCNWIDSAVGFHFRLDSIPSGGPHKFIEFIHWADGGYLIRSTLCITNGQLRLYSSGEPGDGAYYHGAGQIPTTLVANRNYFVHFYSRKTLKVVYLDCSQIMYTGGYAGLEANSGVRIYALGGLHIDDFYTTYTQPAKWPGAYDTYLPYSWCCSTTQQYHRHCVLTAKPIEEVDNQKWKLYKAESLIDALGGDDGEFAITDITWKADMALKLQPIWHADGLKVLHVAGNVRSKRTQAVINQMLIEGRIQGSRIDASAVGFTDSQVEAALALVHDAIHIDTVALATGLGIKPSIDFQNQRHPQSAFMLNVNMRTWDLVNDIIWHLHMPFEPPLFSMETAKPSYIRQFQGRLQVNVSNGESVEIFDCTDFDPDDAAEGRVTGRNVGTFDAEGRQMGSS